MKVSEWNSRVYMDASLVVSRTQRSGAGVVDSYQSQRGERKLCPTKTTVYAALPCNHGLMIHTVGMFWIEPQGLYRQPYPVVESRTATDTIVTTSGAFTDYLTSMILRVDKRSDGTC